MMVSDVGFQQTLKVRILVRAKSFPPTNQCSSSLDLVDELDELTTQKDTGFILVRATVVV